MGQAMLKSCSVCRKAAVEKYRPFCSARCADVDLGRWLGETYRIETVEEPEGIIRIPANPEDND
jgi:endogenous inhibitor of DNA gyrase (YacG/DUF329 family)